MHKPINANEVKIIQDLAAVREQLLQERNNHFYALSSTANWLDITFPETGPHKVAAYVYLAPEYDRLFAEISVHMYCSPQPDQDTVQNRTGAAATCLAALGYRIESTELKVSSFRDVGYASSFKSNHERCVAYSKLQKLLSSKGNGIAPDSEERQAASPAD